ncbi:MAG: glutathione S-transferase family protein [Gammaproteobacteria bacterium]
MKLYSTNYAPNPRRVTMFIAEKGIEGIETEQVDIMKHEHRTDSYRAIDPLARVPALVLDDGRVLSETRAICSYLEGLRPEPNLMGEGFEERAFIEMADRRIEGYLFVPVANWVWHAHPALAVLVDPQIPEQGRVEARKVREMAAWLDGELARKPFMAGGRFTIADITAFCALEFARGLMKYRPGDEGLGNLQAWRDRVAERPSAKAK